MYLKIKMLTALYSHPKVLMLEFFLVTLTIWFAGKFYFPPISTASNYNGEQVYISSVGKLVSTEGVVVNSWRSKQGMRFLTIKGREGQFDVSFFPSLGKLPFVPREGDLIKVTGLLDTYKQKPQISPLSTKTITLIGEVDRTQELKSINPYETVAFDQLEDYMGQTVWIKNIKGVSVEKLTSKKGYKMLRFQVSDNKENLVQGIFAEGNWDKQTYQLLASQQPIKMLAELSTFRGNISLIGRQIKKQ